MDDDARSRPRTIGSPNARVRPTRPVHRAEAFAAERRKPRDAPAADPAELKQGASGADLRKA
jgi:hypothetical protein